MKKRELLENSLFCELPYREKLGIDSKIGIEIEAGLIDVNDIDFLYNDSLKKNGYGWREELSIQSSIPFEIASPKLKDDFSTWNELLLLSNRMKESDIKFEECSFQVNLDNKLSEKELIIFLKLFAIYEDIIYRFSKGYDKHLRNLKFADSIRFDLSIYSKRSNNLKYIIDQYNWNKSYGIALKSRVRDVNVRMFNPIEVIEFRSPNGCDDAWLWQNYVNTFYYFLEYVKKADLDKVDYDFSKIDVISDIKTYEYLDLDSAIQFANMIFDDDIDKLYFIRHYIGIDKNRIIDEYRLIKR